MTKACKTCGKGVETPRCVYCKECSQKQHSQKKIESSRKYNASHRLQRSVSNHNRYERMTSEQAKAKHKKSRDWAKQNPAKMKEIRKRYHAKKGSRLPLYKTESHSEWLTIQQS